MKVIGYINTNGYFPSALTSLVISSNEECFLFYPNGEKRKVVIDFNSKEFEDAFIIEKRSITMSVGKYAFAINNKCIYFNEHQEIIKLLTEHILNNKLKQREYDLITKFTTSTHNFYVEANSTEYTEKSGIDILYILKAMQAGGMADIAQSWLGDGVNQPIEEKHIIKIFGCEKLSYFALQLGLSEKEAIGGLCETLPILIDNASSGGSLLPSIAEKGMNSTDVQKHA